MQSYQEMSKEELYKVKEGLEKEYAKYKGCLLYTSPSPRDA